MKIETVLVHAFVGGKSPTKVFLPTGAKFMSLQLRGEGIYAYHLVPEFESGTELVEFYAYTSKDSIDLDKVIYRDTINYTLEETNQLVVFHIFQSKN